MRPLIALVMGLALAVSGSFAFGQGSAAPRPMLVDDFRDASRWQATASDQVGASLRRAADGALCLDYDFHGVSGYAVARRSVALDLPADYAFTLRLRGEGPANHFQFKLTDASGANVWWVNRPDHVFTPTASEMRFKRRQIEFAWGPASDKMLRAPQAIEFVVAAGRGGGRGSVCFEELRLDERSGAAPRETPQVTASSGGGALAVDGQRTTAWAPRGRGDATLTLDFGAPREFSGALLRWQRRARDYTLSASDDGLAWRVLREVRGGAGPADALHLPESEARFVRLAVPQAQRTALAEITLPAVDAWPTLDAATRALAATLPRGVLPRAYGGEQNYWTLFGVDGGGRHAALISEDGAIEPLPGSASVEPFVRLRTGGRQRLVSWADVRIEQSLPEGYLPLPQVRWVHGDFTLDIQAAAAGDRRAATGLARYTLAARPGVQAELVLVARPMQVNPPQQFLNRPGGFSPIRQVAWQGGVLRLDEALRLRPDRTPAQVLASPADAGPLPAALQRGERLPRLGPRALVDPNAGAQAALVYPADGRGRLVLTLSWPMIGDGATATPSGDRFEAVAAGWRTRLNRVQLSLPPAAQRVHDSLRTALAHMLLSRDGAALQPGTRSYARSWVRDGAMMVAGLLRLGEVDAAREFVDWFAPQIFANGKVPCCIDSRGADPVAENDSHGQLIYAVAELWRHTGDRAALARRWPQVQAATRYMESLRQSERTSANREGERASWFGLMPASISHEGYSAKPMHSYWDDFWALRGYKDAVLLAQALGHDAEAAEFARWRDEFQAEFMASIRTATAQHGIGFVPGAAELGDFDATSTTVALNPAQADGALPPGLLQATFERYWQESEARRQGQRAWQDYTPYELRSVGALVRLGQPARAHAMLDFFFADQRPAGWRQWAEVVMRDPREIHFLGDMPHAWVASDYVRSALDLFAYEREADQALVLAAGVPRDWLASGVQVRDLATPWGRLSYRLQRAGAIAQLHIDDTGLVPPAGGLVLPWAGREIRIDRLPASLDLPWD